jgi:predicted lipid-binding transport protein (Tim44 family)
MAVAAAATLGIAAVAAPHPAQAHDGGRVAAGVLGGLAAGAIIGGAVSGGYGPYGYGPGYGYYAAPAYGGPCYWQRERFWDGYGWRIRRTRVCY